MAALPTTALGNLNATFSSVESLVVGTQPVLELIASAADASYVHTNTNSTHTAIFAMALGDTPSDFGRMSTAAIQLRYLRDVNDANKTWGSLTAQVYKSDGTTALTNAVTVASNITTTTATNSSVINFTGVDTTATKADWDGALVFIRIAATRIKGGTSDSFRVTAAQFTGTYAVNYGVVQVSNLVQITGSDATLSITQGTQYKVTQHGGLKTVLDNPNAYDTSANDIFGYAVGAGGGYVVVGAYQEDDAGGTSSGKAYIFSASTGSLLWTLDNPNAFGTSASDRFGYSVAASGNYVVVGAYLEGDAGGTASGKAYIFSASTGSLLWTLDNPNAYDTSLNDFFGRSVGASGDYVVVGAYQEDDAGGTSSGKAYIFSASTGSLLWTLDNPNPFGTSLNDWFGFSVGASGDYVVVGAHAEDDAGGADSGKAYIFSASTGSLLWTLDNPNAFDTSLSDWFGYSVAVSGDYVVVGAHAEDDAGGADSGKVYIFSASTGSLLWTLNNPNAYGTSANDIFGRSVAVSGDYVVVGAYQEDDAGGNQSGKAYIFSASTGSLLWTLDNPNPFGISASDNFGVSVAVSGATAVVGAYNEDDAGGSSGKAYIYRIAEITSGANDVTISNPFTTTDLDSAGAGSSTLNTQAIGAANAAAAGVGALAAGASATATAAAASAGVATSSISAAGVLLSTLSAAGAGATSFDGDAFDTTNLGAAGVGALTVSAQVVGTADAVAAGLATTAINTGATLVGDLGAAGAATPTLSAAIVLSADMASAGVGTTGLETPTFTIVEADLDAAGVGAAAFNFAAEHRADLGSSGAATDNLAGSALATTDAGAAGVSSDSLTTATVLPSDTVSTGVGAAAFDLTAYADMGLGSSGTGVLQPQAEGSGYVDADMFFSGSASLSLGLSATSQSDANSVGTGGVSTAGVVLLTTDLVGAGTGAAAFTAAAIAQAVANASGSAVTAPDASVFSLATYASAGATALSLVGENGAISGVDMYLAGAGTMSFVGLSEAQTDVAAAGQASVDANASATVQVDLASDGSVAVSLPAVAIALTDASSSGAAVSSWLASLVAEASVASAGLSALSLATSTFLATGFNSAGAAAGSFDLTAITAGVASAYGTTTVNVGIEDANADGQAELSVTCSSTAAFGFAAIAGAELTINGVSAALFSSPSSYLSARTLFVGSETRLMVVRGEGRAMHVRSDGRNLVRN